MVSGNFIFALFAASAVASPIASAELEKRQGLSDLIKQLTSGSLSLQSIAKANGGKGIDLSQLVGEADKKGGEPGAAKASPALEKRQGLSDLIKQLLGGQLSLQSIAKANGGKGIDLSQLVGEADKQGGEPGAAKADAPALEKRQGLSDLIKQLTSGSLSLQSIAKANGGKGIDLSQLVGQADKQGGEPGASPSAKAEADSTVA